MEKMFYYARVKYDAARMGEKLGAVIEAHEKLMDAIAEYENAARDGLQVNLRQAVTDRPSYRRIT